MYGAVRSSQFSPNCKVGVCTVGASKQKQSGSMEPTSELPKVGYNYVLWHMHILK